VLIRFRSGGGFDFDIISEVLDAAHEAHGAALILPVSWIRVRNPRMATQLHQHVTSRVLLRSRPNVYAL
jgi:hypothetical protein